MVFRGAGDRAWLGVDAADHRLLGRDTAGGHRHLRAGPARVTVTLLRRGPVQRQARERRLPLPEPRPRVPRRLAPPPSPPPREPARFTPPVHYRSLSPATRR